MAGPERPTAREQLWGAAGVLIGLTVFWVLVYSFPTFFEGSKDWGFLMVIVFGGACMLTGGRLMQRLYRQKRLRSGP